MCFVWLSEETLHFPLYIINILVFILVTEVESVYSAVRSTYVTQISFVLKGLKDYQVTNEYEMVQIIQTSVLVNTPLVTQFTTVYFTN